MSNIAASTKTVQLPLERLDKCSRCQQKHADSTPLRTCQNCAEILYCSEECQKADWSSHKDKCGRGKTDRIDLKQFYPFLACLAEAGRFSQVKPEHRGQAHAILNNPSPKATVCSFPDGSAANLLILGEEVPLTDPVAWWPSAATSPIRSKLFRRIQREGYLLPLLMSVCIGLLGEMYTSTPETGRRVRLRHGKSPISDFGIARGKATVKSQDKLAYFYLTDDTFEKGQDPDEHYWLYFTTLSGMKMTLDVGMFTFNFCLYVSGQPYFENIHSVPFPPMSAPAFYVDPEMARSTPKLTTTLRECSVLRNKALQTAVTSPVIDWEPIFTFMSDLAGKPVTLAEKRLVKDVSSACCRSMARIISNHAYMKWPEEPLIDIETDPGEIDNKPTDDDQEWLEYMKKWNRKYNKGKVSQNALRHAIERFEARRAREAGLS